ncbi:MAG: TolC family protein [Oligoflexia bacterium]|nr:TolC family protein [Oligoflexia bacterium]
MRSTLSLTFFIFFANAVAVATATATATAFAISFSEVRGKEMLLDEKQVVALALKNNPNIHMAKLDYQLALQELEASQTDFDPLLFLNPSYSDKTVLPNSTLSLENYYERTTTFAVGVKKKFSLGLQAEYSFQNLTIRSNDTNAVAHKRTQNAMQLKFNQPLLKGGWFAANLERERTSRLKLARYEEKIKIAIDQEVEKSLVAFWDYYLAMAEVSFSKRKVNAKKLLYEKEQSITKIKGGSGVDLWAAKADYFLEKALLEDKLSEQIEKESTLKKSVLAVDENFNFTQLTVKLDEKQMAQRLLQQQKTVAEGEAFCRVHLDLERGSRAVVKEKEIALRMSEVTKEKKLNEILPKLNLSLEFTYSGLSTQTQDAIQQAYQRKYPGAMLLLEFVWPFGNNSAEGGYLRALAESNKASYDILKQRESERQEQNNLCHKVAYDLERLQNYVEREESVRFKLEYKEKRFTIGLASYVDYIKEENEYYKYWVDKTKTLVEIHKDLAKLEKLVGRHSQLQTDTLQ